MNKDDLIKYALLAVGAYIVWEYVISPMLNPTATAAPSTGTTTSAPVTTTSQPTTTTTQSPVTTTQPPVTTTAPAPTAGGAGPTLQQQIQSLAGAGVTSLTLDQWNYYYNQILAGRGQSAVSPATFGIMQTAAGVTETNNPPITLAAFMSALGAAGLSGIVQTVPRGMNFGGFKGFGGGMGSRMVN